MYVEPIGPVAGEFEEVLEVRESGVFKVGDQVLHRIVLRDGTDAHQRPFHAKLVGGQPKPLVYRRAGQPAPLERVLANDQGRMASGEIERHRGNRLKVWFRRRANWRAYTQGHARRRARTRKDTHADARAHTLRGNRMGSMRRPDRSAL